MNSWTFEGALFTVLRRGYSKRTFTFIGLCGIVLLPAGLGGMLVLLSEQGFSFSQPVLIFHFISALGFGMTSAGFFSTARHSHEQIVFDNTAEKVTFQNTSTGETFDLSYGTISHIHTFMEKGGPDYPDVYHVYLIKKDMAECWVTGFSSGKAKNEYIKFVEELALHTGFAVKDSSNVVNERPAARSYNRAADNAERPLSPYIRLTASGDKTCIRIKPASRGAFSYFTGLYIMIFFMAAPLYLLHIFGGGSFPACARWILYFFCAAWYFILTSIMILSAKNYMLSISGAGLTIVMWCKLAPFLKASVEIPRDRIRHVRTNRLPDGNGMLSLGIDPSFMLKKEGALLIMNSSLFKDAKLAEKLSSAKTISLWSIAADIKKGKGPQITDLEQIESIIETKLMLGESA